MNKASVALINSKPSNIHVVGIPKEGRDKKKIWRNVNENFSKVMKATNLENQVQWTPSTKNMKETVSRYITVKFLKNEGFKSSQRNRHIMYQE